MKKERIFWGLFFLLAAVLVILNRFSLFAEISLIRLLVTIALVIWMLQSIIHRSMTGILFSIAFLLICYDDLLPLEPLTPGTLLLAATFASIGFHFLIPHRSGSFDDCREARDWADAAQESVSDNCVRLKTTMGTGIKYVSSADFQQADIECSMGAMKVYFDNAHIVQESAVIRLSARMCGIELYVPRSWNITEACTQTLSNIQESGYCDASVSQMVRIEGKLSLSTVKIIYI